MFEKKQSLGRKLTLAAATLATAGLLAGCATTGQGGAEDNFPSGPIEFYVGASAGGSTDQLARKLAQELTTSLGVDVVVTNKPGGNGAVAAQEVFSKKADGQTIMLVSGSLITITPMFVEEAAAISVDDFTMVTGVGKEDYILVAHKDGDIKSIDDIVNSGRNIKYATAGHGTGGYLSQKLLFDALKIDSTDVPFEGGAPAVTALLGQEVDVASVQLLEAAPHLDAGVFVPIAVFGDERSPFLPDVPTVKESGYDAVVTQSRFVLAAPNTPQAVVDKLNEAFAAAFKSADYQAFIASSYIAPDETGPAETVTNLENTRKGYEEKARAAGLIK